MKAVLLSGPSTLQLFDAPEPVAANGDAVLRVLACGICGSDLSCYASGVFAPVVLGHEVAGVVEDPGASGVPPGTLVAIDPKTPCGSCADCAAGAPNRCPTALVGGVGQGRPGGLAERVAVPATNLYAMDGLEPATAALTEPLSCAIHAIEQVPPFAAGGEVVVVGLGPIGLLTIAALRAQGRQGRITGIDPVKERRSLALKIGADDATEAPPFALTAPVVFECSGKEGGLRSATTVAAPGGIVVLVGIPLSDASVSPLVWVARETTLIGSIASTPRDMADSAAMLKANPEIGRIVTHRIPFGDVAATFASPAGDQGKVVVEPGL